MERRYQVFISSTYIDLIDERREVIQALLEMDCLPAGMEMFPAADDDQLSLIRRVIEESDYYVVIVGNRYGSLSAEGISYTEAEYDYAVSAGIPVLGFVHAHPEEISFNKSDTDRKAQKKLSEFRAKVMSRMTKTYSSPAELGSVVSRSLMRVMKQSPREGWVRGQFAMTEEVRTEIAELRAKVAELESAQIRSESTAFEQDLTLEQGDDETEIEYQLSSNSWDDDRKWEGTAAKTWDEILVALGPLMIDEASTTQLRQRLSLVILKDAQEDKKYPRVDLPSVSIDNASWDQVIVQLRALSYIESGTKKRTVSDKSTYWKLTAAGDNRLVELLARRRE